MPGERGLEGNLRRLRVAHFADHDDVRVLAQDRAQVAREIRSGLVADLRLRDAGQPPLDRILDGDDVDVG